MSTRAMSAFDGTAVNVADPPDPGSGSPGAGATFDAAGLLTYWTVTDAGDMQPWSSFRTNYDAQGNIVSQLGINDGGTSWLNVYDPTGANRGLQYTDYFDAAGRLVSHTQTNSDGTHSLTAYDTTNSNIWSTFTQTFDASWNVTSLTGTNHDGSHTVDAKAINAFLDTLTWYANPYVVDGASPPSDPRPTISGTPPFADPRSSDPIGPIAVALASLTSDGLQSGKLGAFADISSAALSDLPAASVPLMADGRGTVADTGPAPSGDGRPTPSGTTALPLTAPLDAGSMSLRDLIDDPTALAPASPQDSGATDPLGSPAVDDARSSAGLSFAGSLTQLVNAMAGFSADRTGFETASLAGAAGDGSGNNVVVAAWHPSVAGGR
jgi:hypothetical protein